jgi:hypothetical protein
VLGSVDGIIRVALYFFDHAMCIGLFAMGFLLSPPNTCRFIFGNRVLKTIGWLERQAGHGRMEREFPIARHIGY